MNGSLNQRPQACEDNAYNQTDHLSNDSFEVYDIMGAHSQNISCREYSMKC